MEVIEAVYKRRAIRSYTEQKVDAGTIHKLIEAAIQAPSAVNQQPWGFVVVEDKKILKRISDEAKKDIKVTEGMKSPEHQLFLESLSDPKFNIFYNAPALIIIYAHVNGYDPSGDCFLAGENLMLTAYSLGLGTCPIGFARDILNRPEYKKEFNIPSGYSVVLPIIVGYPKEKPEPVVRKEPKIFSWNQS